MIYRTLTWGIALFLAEIVIVLAAYTYGRYQSPFDIPVEEEEDVAPYVRDTEGVALYAEALKAIEENYVYQEALDSEKQAYGAIEGMIHSLDDERHTRFLTPEEVEQTQDAVSDKHAGASWNLFPGTELAHLRLALFSENAAEDLEEAIAEAQEAGAERFVLDLRDNKGGLVKQAEKVAAQFLATRSEIYTRKDADGRKEKSVPEGNEPLDAPLVVLVNRESASSAEIVAGALRDNDRARIVGDTTFGTGTVLDEYILSDGSAVLLAVAEWLTPRGDFIQGSGIEPDIEVELEEDQEPRTPDETKDLTREEIFAEDAQLERAFFEVLQEE
jgi:C-terminal processing protease CtpA/Prc